MKKEKGQAAMEYLQTYGWALLLIIIIFAILVWLFLNSTGPRYCLFDDSGMSCSEPAPVITSDGYLLAQIKNVMGKGIYIKGLLCVEQPPVNLSFYDPRTKYIFPPEYLGSGDSFLVNKYNLTCYSGDKIVNLSERSFHGHLYVWYNYVSDPPTYNVRYFHATFNVDVLQQTFANLTEENESGGGGGSGGGNGTTPEPSFVCGDGVCDSGEICAMDCGTVPCNNNGVCDDGEGLSCGDCSSENCGDGTCDSNENSLTCPPDCGGSGPGPGPNPVCGNNICENGETVENCPSDCSTDTCGNYVCELTENPEVCPTDCSDDSCGNGVCEDDETIGTCPDDCNDGSVCGDEICGFNEECSEDCSNEIWCSDDVDNDEDGLTDCEDPDCSGVNGCPLSVCDNDGECEPERGETRSNCAVDCGVCDNNGECEPEYGENWTTCPSDCHCGNGICEDGQEGREDYNENPLTCPEDCESSGNAGCHVNGICEVWYDREGNVYREPDDCIDCQPHCNNDGICQNTVVSRVYYGCRCSYNPRRMTYHCVGCSGFEDIEGPPNENEENCRDCSCGNGVCEPDSPLNEDKDNCPEDCCPPDHCGNGECDCGETKDSCPEDCVICGDGVCDLEYGENMSNCEVDCAECGNGECEPDKDENNENCPEDCYCGDGICLEGYGNCNADCPYCGDGVCNVEFGETTGCRADCPWACGNGVCEVGESAINCPSDCHCGNQECEPDLGENIETCPIDCDFCGDGVCETQYGENHNNCPGDCPSSWCGNGACDHGETSRTCPADCCSPICGDGECEYWCGETIYICESDCGSCGNGVCDHGETYETCSIDCKGPDDDTVDANSKYCGKNPPDEETALRKAILTVKLSNEDDPTDTQLLIVDPTLEARRFNTGILSLTTDPKRSNIEVVNQNTLRATWEDWTDFDCNDIAYDITVRNGRIKVDYKSSDCAGWDGLTLNLKFEKPTRVRSLSSWFRYDETGKEHSIVLPRDEDVPLCSPLSGECSLCSYCCVGVMHSSLGSACARCPSQPFDVEFDIVGWDGSWTFSQD